MGKSYLKHDRKNEKVMSQAVANVMWVPIEKVTPNNWNPNSVAKNEMKLLYTSIKQDTYTQPVVTFYNEEEDLFEIVDGFHRYTTMRLNADIMESTGGLLPIVVIDKPINDRMASTVRHNRARGKHSVNGMSSMVFAMLKEGWEDAQICNQIGLEPEELLKLKHITGFSKLFENVEFKKSWTTNKMIKLKKEYDAENKPGNENRPAQPDQTVLAEPTKE